MRRLAMGVRPPGDELRVLDVGTGSGAIAISIAADLRRRRVHRRRGRAAGGRHLAGRARPRARERRRARRRGPGPVRGRRPHPARRGPRRGRSSSPTCRTSAPTRWRRCRSPTTFEPALALDGGADGLEVIGRLLDLLPRVLADGGIAFLEIGADQGEAIVELVGRAARGLGLSRRAGPGGPAAGRGHRAGSRMSLQDATRAAAIRGTEPGFPVRLIALDIDGTLVGDDLVVGPRTIDAVRAAQGARRGGLAGHRPDGVERHAVRARARADRPDHRLPGRPDPGHAGARVDAAREAPRAHAPPAGHGARDRDVDPRARARPAPQPPRAVHPPRRRPAGRRLLGVHGRAGRAVCRTCSRQIDHPITKILAVGEPPLPTEMAPAAAAAFAGVADVTISHPRFLEFVAPGVSKGRAIRWLARRLGIPLARTLAIGDQWNDIEMLAEVGHGAAMPTAPGRGQGGRPLPRPGRRGRGRRAR